jgi:hypothetical protein
MVADLLYKVWLSKPCAAPGVPVATPCVWLLQGAGQRQWLDRKPPCKLEQHAEPHPPVRAPTQACLCNACF